MHIVVAQVLSMVGIFSSMVAVFLLPYWWVGRRPASFESSSYRENLSLVNCFSGGVFLSTFFIGLMPEVRSMFRKIFHTYNITSDFPLTEFVILVGFLFAVAIEQCFLKYQERDADVPVYSSIPSSAGESDSSLQVESETLATSSENKTIEAAAATETDDESRQYSSSVEGQQVSVAYQCVPQPSHKHGHGHSHADIGLLLQGEKGIRLGFLLVSLGVHSLFEGLAVGLQTTVSTLVNLVIGLIVHELLVAFAMGVSVSRLKLTTANVLKLALVFSTSIPVGQLLGLLIGQYRSTASQLISAVLQGLAAGTFIQVTFLEIIPAEFQEKGSRLLKVFFLFLGFILLLLCISLIQGVTSHKH